MHKLTVVNLTSETILVTLASSESNTKGFESISSSSSSTYKTSKWTGFASIHLSSHSTEPSSTVGWNLTIPRCSKHLWKYIPNGTHGSVLPWTIYHLKLSPRCRQLIVLPKRTLSSFLADMSSSLPLSSLMLPGTHESCAFYGWPISQCQYPATPLAIQLKSGIRVLDIRLSVINGVLISYHGVYPEKLPFLDILRTAQAFLSSTEGKTETIVMSVKPEDQGSTVFSDLVRSAIYDGPGGKQMWYLENRIPTLGEVRGKIVLFRRFFSDGTGWEGGLEGLGIYPTTWPDSKPDGFEWWLKGTKIKTHDWYSIGSFVAIPEKATRSSQVLLQPNPAPSSPILSISFLSASSFPLALPQIVALGFGWPALGLGVEDVNSRVVKWILSLFAGNKIADSAHDVASIDKEHTVMNVPAQSNGSKLRGWCLMDYMDMNLVRLLVECNYQG